jgi:hypothetical protein
MAFTTTSNEQQQKKSVRFGSCFVREIEHLNDLTEQDVADKWLTGEEFQEIHDGYNSVVNRILAGEEFHEDDEHASRRGLECWIPSVADEKTQAIYEAVRSVLVEQEIQKDEEIYNDELLAEAYCQSLGNSSELARSAALEDEQEAARIYNANFGRFRKNKKLLSPAGTRKGRRSVISQLKGAAKSMRLSR